jgi:hypothetical protein
MKKSGHISIFRPDECFLSEDAKNLFIGCVCNKSGVKHTDRQFYFYPDEVFCQKDDEGEEIFFVPVIPLNIDRESVKMPMPIYMGDFSEHHKKEIITYGERNGLNITEDHFLMPKNSIISEEQLDYGTLENEVFCVDEEDIDGSEVFDKLEMADETIEG